MLAALSTPDTIVAIVCAVAAVRGAVKGFAWQVVRTIGLIGHLNEEQARPIGFLMSHYGAEPIEYDGG